MKLIRIWACWALAIIPITLVHEVGHLVVAQAFGARSLELRVGPFGGGSAHWDGSALGSIGELLALAGGILLNVATGLPLLLASRRLRTGSMLAIASCITGAVSLVFVAGYLFLGVYRGLGDPGQFVRLASPGFFAAHEPPLLRTLLIGTFAIAVLAATWVCARDFLRHQVAIWPGSSRIRRVLLGAILVAPVVIVFGLRVLVFDPSGVGQQMFRGDPPATTAILADLEETDPGLDGAARFKRTAQILRERRAVGPVDNEPPLASGSFVLIAAMGLVGGVAIAGAAPTASRRRPVSRWSSSAATPTRQLPPSEGRSSQVGRDASLR